MVLQRPAMGVDLAISEFAAAWNSSDAATRWRHLVSTWGARGVFADPTVFLVGRDALFDHIGALRREYPQVSFSVRDDVEHHHGQVHFAWTLLDAGGVEILSGRSVGAFDDEGRLGRLVGFFTACPRRLVAA